MSQKKNQTNSKLLKSPQSLRSLLLTLSKNKMESKQSDRKKEKPEVFFNNTSRDFVIKGLISKADSGNACRITIKGYKDNMHLRYKLSTVRNLY